ncbi:MAG: glycoside hydrolase family 16 protein [Spirochaetales bacterium]|nr:glycoside hydrolase family 16 protein [Spirochaetales bacterium]
MLLPSFLKARILKPISVLLLMGVFSQALSAEGNQENDPGILPSSTGWKLVWHDNFSSEKSLTHGVWLPEEYPPLANNSELQAYTGDPANIHTSNDHLVLEALRTKTKNGWKITSGRISSSMKLAFRYGRLDFRAKLPLGKGTWPALWLLPLDPSGHGYMWPDSGEIDVMEEVGFEGNQIHGTLHTSKYNYTLGTQITATYPVRDVTQWHVYSLEWYPDHITFLVDNHPFLTFNKDGGDWRRWPFDKPFYIIMNLAIGGTWGGQHGVDNKLFPAKMEVDWVRLYQNPSVPGSEIVHP